MHSPDFKEKKVLVTGANGYLGSWMVEALLDAGASCVAVTGLSQKLGWLEPFKDKLKIVSADLSATSPEALLELFGEDVDHIFHMAAVGVNQSADNLGHVAEVNIHGTLNILNYAQKAGVQSVVVTGSGFEYPPGLRIEETTPPQPGAFYALTKAASSLASVSFAHLYDLPVSVLRPFVVYGPREAEHRLVTQVCKAVLKKQPVDITSGQQLRDWVYVEDAIAAHLRAALTPEAAGEIINVATGQAVSVKDVAMRIAHIGGADPSLLSFGTKADRPQEIWEQSGSPEKAQRILDWSATTSLEEGLKKTLEWYKNHGGT